MKRIAVLVLAIGAVASAQPAEDFAPIYGVKLPAGYRDWALISVARVGSPLNDMRAKLGNDVAIKAYREGKLPFPDGTIIARLAWNQTTSEENNTQYAASSNDNSAPMWFRSYLPNLSRRGRRRPFSSWSRTRRNTPRPAAGDSRSSPTANPTARRCIRPVLPVTHRPKIATLFSRATHVD
jgi:hypothetical protein